MRIMFTGPFTEPASNIQVWAQREYVECMQRGFGFSAHDDYWFYKCGNRAYVCTAPTYNTNDVTEKLAFDPKSIEWIDEGRKLINRHL